MRCSNCGYCYYDDDRCSECLTPNTKNIDKEKEGR